MTINKLKSLWPVLVLSFGLVSCFKDKQVVYQRDDFKPSQVTVQGSGGDGEKIQSLDADNRVLDAGGVLTFDSLKDRDFSANPVLFSVQAQCRQNGRDGTMENRYDFQNTASVAVIKLLPEDILASLKVDEATCDFTIVTTDGNTSSSNTNVWKNTTIRNLLKYSNWDPSLSVKDRVDYDAEKDVPVMLPTKGSVRLACADISKVLGGTNSQFKLSGLGLLDGEILQKLNSPNETCRWIVIGDRAVYTSPIFTLDFPVAPPSVRGLVQNQTLNNHFNKPTVLVLAIVNPNLFPITVKISKSAADKYLFRPIFIQDGATAVGQPQTIPIVWKGPGDTVVTGDEMVFHVAGGSGLNVYGIANRDMTCQPEFLNILDAPPPGQLKPFHFNTYYGGGNFDYEISSYVSVQNGADWDEVPWALEGNTLTLPQSELHYWNWPNNDSIIKAYGRMFDLFQNLREQPFTCK